MSNNSRTRWPLVNRLSRLLHSWWRGDRIRAAPGDGRLLRLEPPCYLLIDELPVAVESRSVEDSVDGTAVIYGCRIVTQPAKLIVKSWDQAAVEWHVPQGVRTVPAGVIEVYTTQ